MKNKYITISLIVVTILIGISLILTSGNNQIKGEDSEQNSVVIIDGIQIINVIANSNGYTPKSVIAKSGINTTLRMTSQNTYGCERSFRIPSMDINQLLPVEGSVDINLGIPDKGEDIFGSCSMGMYTFKISFE